MEENVALDSSKQKKFIKSIKGLQKTIKKKKTQAKDQTPVTPKVQEEKIKKKKRVRGLVYLGHIPHGFYEHQMTQYFSQFGGVSNCRVIRSRRTGRSKGYAFVEFHDPAVAQIVAETMNNYLMGKRLIKAAYIPPDKRRWAMRYTWNPQNNPVLNTNLKLKKQYNAVKSDAEELRSARKLMKSLNKTKKKLKELGINYDFFMPVDIPEELTEIE
ncbi:nucleolar phosphoprotein [Bombyx mori]|uniref:Nucleolar phosphoprotein n=1 Tax=Bombyx mori TaxID=7091 RepID=Q0ZAL4_BOMMO|nr:nucleolar phosphoprotein [Bombyx mori]ABG43000.1 nucleolar phosphoprotein [Bombyx mori]